MFRSGSRRSQWAWRCHLAGLHRLGHHYENQAILLSPVYSTDFGAAEFRGDRVGEPCKLSASKHAVFDGFQPDGQEFKNTGLHNVTTTALPGGQLLQELCSSLEFHPNCSHRLPPLHRHRGSSHHLIPGSKVVLKVRNRNCWEKKLKINPIAHWRRTMGKQTPLPKNMLCAPESFSHYLLFSHPVDQPHNFSCPTISAAQDSCYYMRGSLRTGHAILHVLSQLQPSLVFPQLRNAIRQYMEETYSACFCDRPDRTDIFDHSAAIPLHIHWILVWL